MDKIRGTTVTGRIQQIKQPYGGLLPEKSFLMETFDDGVDLIDLNKENIPPQLMGKVIGYLTRYYSNKQFGEKTSVQDAFDIALLGAKNLGIAVMSKALESLVQIKNSQKIDDNVIKSACYLSSLDIAYRVGSFAYKESSNCIPDSQTIESIKLMVERSMFFFKNEGDLVHPGFTLESSSYTDQIVKGDGDFTTGNGLWDMKVSVSKPRSKETLQLIIYDLMGLNGENLKDHFKKNEKVGIFNPRLNKSYTLKISDINPKTINIISRDIIGYKQEEQI